MLRLTFAPGGQRPASSEGRLVQAWSTETGEIYATAHVSPRARWIDWPGLATFVFTPDSDVVTAWPAPGVGSDAIAATFARVLQPVILQATGWQVLHASSVAIDGRVVALCGRSGAGKSTLAYALGRRWPQWSDDAVVIDPRGLAVRLPFTPRLRPPAREVFRDAPVGGSPLQDAPRLPLGAVLVLEQDAGQAELVRCRRIPPSAAFRLLITHAHCFDQTDGGEVRRLVNDSAVLAETVPVHAMTYRPGFDHLQVLVEAVLEIAAPANAVESDRDVCAIR